ncbi:HesA/MoeB/ThiF family protein [Cryptosporangium sp. NPDC048952]|uniref:HesA/MoeB/ThiF family protein n=1 Tax=Cryptosporangium sp. NPDC048952 TaxID=3363961 RepID=UPI00371F0896
MTTDLAARLTAHLHRDDGQEDLCFVAWRPSVGATRTTAILAELILPADGERDVHGNVSFTSAYFLRAAARAAAAGCGLALIHSHPTGRGWQSLSRDDQAAEAGHAGQATAITGLPLLGLTFAGIDRAHSARFWHRVGARRHEPMWCESVREVGDRIAVTWNNSLRPAPASRSSQARTVSAWGEEKQSSLARLHVGVVGAGSVGALVAEALARVGIEYITLFDFDTVEIVNLDRLLHARLRDAQLRRAKVDVLARALRYSATARRPRIRGLDYSVTEPAGFAHALDCDVIFSCVDRPWPRAALNLAAYAHLIPVVDGGILVRASPRGLRGAEWRSHLAAPGRACLECLGQYDPGLVSLERTGMLDDATYIVGLDADHPLRRNENVFPFSAATAANEVLQLLTATIAPNGIGDLGGNLYHFATGTLDNVLDGCKPSCVYSTVLQGAGVGHGVDVTGSHPAAERARAHRRRFGQRPGVRLRRTIDDLLAALI